MWVESIIARVSQPDAVLAGDLLLLGVDKPPVSNDVRAPHDQPVDSMRAGEHEACDGILRARELEAVGSPDRQVGALAGLERPDVVSPQHSGPPARREPKRLSRAHRAATAARAGDEQRLLHLEEEVAALIRRRAVDAEPEPDARVEQLAHRRDPGAEPQVGGRAMGDADTLRPEELDFRVGEGEEVRGWERGGGVWG
jgi:hypothetical protein